MLNKDNFVDKKNVLSSNHLNDTMFFDDKELEQIEKRVAYQKAKKAKKIKKILLFILIIILIIIAVFVYRFFKNINLNKNGSSYNTDFINSQTVYEDQNSELIKCLDKDVKIFDPTNKPIKLYNLSIQL